MRTTLTLDDDVAAQLSQLREARNVPLKSLVNEALRSGLQALAEPEQSHRPHSTRGVDLGRCLLGQIDDVAEVLSIAEGEAFK